MVLAVVGTVVELPRILVRLIKSGGPRSLILGRIKFLSCSELPGTDSTTLQGLLVMTFLGGEPIGEEEGG